DRAEYGQRDRDARHRSFGEDLAEDHAAGAAHVACRRQPYRLTACVACNMGSGSIGVPLDHCRTSSLFAMAKCRCGALGEAFPVKPTYPISCPRASGMASCKSGAYRSRCAYMRMNRSAE